MFRKTQVHVKMEYVADEVEWHPPITSTPYPSHSLGYVEHQFEPNPVIRPVRRTSYVENKLDHFRNNQIGSNEVADRNINLDSFPSSSSSQRLLPSRSLLSKLKKLDKKQGNGNSKALSIHCDSSSDEDDNDNNSAKKGLIIKISSDSNASRRTNVSDKTEQDNKKVVERISNAKIQKAKAVSSKESQSVTQTANNKVSSSLKINSRKPKVSESNIDKENSNCKTVKKNEVVKSSRKLSMLPVRVNVIEPVKQNQILKKDEALKAVKSKVNAKSLAKHGKANEKNINAGIEKPADLKSVKKATALSRQSRLPKIALKRKNSEDVNNFKTVKKAKSDAPLAKVEVQCKEIGSTANNEVENSRHSLSHEIFSDSKGQELLESLDLTSVEVEETVKNDLVSLKNGVKNPPKKMKVSKNPKTTSKSTENSNANDKAATQIEKPNSISSLEDNRRPKRERKAPKDYWIPDVNATEKKAKTEMPVNKAEDKQIKKHVEVPISEKNSEVEEKKHSKTSKDCFKNASDVEFRQSSSGKYLIADCWKLRNFKCGVLKIPSKSDACGTQNVNSYLGGFVVQGRIRMKIGDSEEESTEGDMFCIPPCSDWRAVNLEEREAIINYWCGLF